MELPPFTFVHPANIILAGPTGAGKTHFLVRELERGTFFPKPTRIVWVYGESQGDHETLNELTRQGRIPKVTFMKNETNYADIVEDFDKREVNLLVLDDQMTESKSNKAAFTNVFTKGSHHRNITVILMLQNIFESGFLTVRRNAQYTVLFRTRADQQQILRLGYQMYPTLKDFFLQVFTDATKEAYSYIIVDSHQKTLEELTILANLGNNSARVYVPVESDIAKALCG